MSERPPQTERRSFINWLWRLPVIAVFLGGGYGLYEAFNMQFRKTRPSATPQFTAGTPVAVADLGELSEVWDSAEFTFGTAPALLLHLPAAVPGGLSVSDKHFAAFSRICTHQSCIVNLNRNTEALAVAFNYRTDGPALACNCHFSVFLPTEAGRAVSGPAREPLPRIQLELRGSIIYAMGLEVVAQH